MQCRTQPVGTQEVLLSLWSPDKMSNSEIMEQHMSKRQDNKQQFVMFLQGSVGPRSGHMGNTETSSSS